MRDEDEKRRFMEQQLRDTERSQFKRLQAAGGLQPAVPPPDPGAQQKDRPPARWAFAGCAALRCCLPPLAEAWPGLQQATRGSGDLDCGEGWASSRHSPKDTPAIGCTPSAACKEGPPGQPSASGSAGKAATAGCACAGGISGPGRAAR